MKRSFTALGLGLALIFSLTGCTMTQPTVTPTPTHTVTPSTTVTPEYNAGPDGQVEPTQPNAEGRGRSNHSAMEDVGRGIENSIHSAENAIKKTTRDVRNAVQ